MKPTLVFLHYFGGASASWQWTIDLLKEDYPCLALDLPGFGGTAAPKQRSLPDYASFVYDVLEQHNIRTYVLVGHSMGGKIALQMASEKRDSNLQGVFLIAPSPPTQEPMPEKERQRLLKHHPSRENAQTTVDNATLQTLSKEQYEIAIQTHMIAESQTWKWWLTEGMKHSIASQLPQVTVPVTVLVSEDDPVIPQSAIEKDISLFLQSAKMHTVQGIGHLFPLEAPTLVAECIRTYMADVKDGQLTTAAF